MTVDILVDLRETFGPARHQGSRPTCLAFALSDAHAAARGRYEALSVEHLYYHAVQRTPACDPDDGVAVAEAAAALQLDGQCTELGWPYLNPLPNDRSRWKPPATATPIYRRDSSGGTSLVTTVVGHLSAGAPVVLILLLGERFYRPVDALVTPGPNDADVDYHAVIAVGVGKTAQGEQCVLVRNSWGLNWGLEGHAWITVSYIAQRLRGTLLMSP